MQNEKKGEFVDSFLETLKQLGAARLAIMAGVVMALLMFFVFVSIRVSTGEMKLLYDDLSTSDSSAMAAYLGEAKIPFDLSTDGTRIEVPSDLVAQARMVLAAEGLPSDGSMGYEIFDKQSGFGTTNFVQNINQVRALEGELARTISSMEGLRSARVHLVLPQRELFSRDKQPASASIFLGLRPGVTLQREQILAIQSLVASAVPQLKPENVSLIDNNGNLLARGDADTGSMLTMKAEEMRRSYETRLTSSIEDIVSRVVGYGRVRANVTADLNFDRISTNEELYNPEGQVLRSTQVTEESNTERDQSNNEDVSVQNNLPGIAGDMFVDQKPSSETNRVEEVSNYEISKTIRSSVREVGEVRRLSVAVLVDGTYTEDEEGNKTYQPRTQEELDQISSLVRSAIGFDDTRGDTLEVVNMQFANIETEDPILEVNDILGFDRDDLLDTAEIIIVVIMIMLVILLVLRPMMTRLLDTSPPESAEDMEHEFLTSEGPRAALEGPSADYGGGAAMEEEEENMIDMQKVEGKVKRSSIKKVEEIIDSYPEETVSVIRGWMSQEG